jgi:predicted kinase
MANIIILVGPPGCGKTTWAKLYTESHVAKRVNKDDLRKMTCTEYNGQDEKVIKRIRNYAIESWLQKGYDVVVDDTNLDKYIFTDMQQIASRVGDIGVQEHRFIIDMETCRNQNEDRAVGVVPEKDWNGLWLAYTLRKKNDDFYAPPIDLEMLMRNEELKVSILPRAVIVDLDNTIAMFPNGREPFEHEKIPNDIPNRSLLYILNILSKRDVEIIIVSGRNGITEEATRQWLSTNDVWFDSLYMRPPDKEYASIRDYLVKKEIYEKHIKDKFFVICAFEDREQTTVGWRALGIPTCQVDFGRY